MTKEYTIKPYQSELDDISNAEKEIAEICAKYGISLIGDYELYDDDYNWDDPITCETDKIHVVSSRFNDRVIAYKKEQEERERERILNMTQRFFDSTKELYPNHRNLELTEKEWDMPTYFGHGAWHTTSVFVEGLIVKDWSKVKHPLFAKNPNGYWQYNKSLYDDRVQTSVNLSIYPYVDTPTFFSHPGNIKFGVYADGSDMYDTQSQAFVIQIVDELIDVGVLELKGE